MQEIDTACHEAGHAVMGCLLDRAPLSVTIVRVGQIAGQTFYEPGVPGFAKLYLDASPAKRRYTEKRF